MSSLNPAPHEKPKSSLLTVLKRRAIELETYTKGLTAASNQATPKFVIYGQGRTGSELLCDLLSCHPLIHCDQEILFYHTFFPKLFVTGKQAASPRKVYGFKVKIYQLQEVQHCEPRQFLSDLLAENWKIIHIQRENILRQGISLLTARQRKKFHIKSKKQKPSDRKVWIDCDLLLRQMIDREAYQKADAEVLAGLPHITVTYEQDLLSEAQHQPTIDRICRYLEIPIAPVQTTFVRLTPDKLSDLVENYDELVNVISKSPYAGYLEDNFSLPLSAS
jgi:LPS sulfotransferase NodH